MNKSYELVTIYEAYKTDGGGLGIHTSTIGYFTTEEKAREARKPGTIDFNYTSVKQRSALKIGEEYFLLASPHPVDADNIKAARREVLRQQALEKLTMEEREALGLK